jgi:hypothetical protein
MLGREFEATDPRDKIYSLRGLARVPIEGAETMQQQFSSSEESESEKTEAFPVDYSKTVSEEYKYLAKYLINRDRNLDVLCILSMHRNAESHDLPSWTPDWRVPASEIPITTCWDYFTMKFAAASFIQPTPKEEFKRAWGYNTADPLR